MIVGDDAERLRAIAGAADVLIDGRHGAGWDEGAAGHAALRAAFPHLHIVSISWFGESGPYRDYAATDATVRALAGLVRQVGNFGETPVVQPQSQAYLPGALSAFSAALAALISDSPGGRKFEVSIHEANACEPEFQAAVTVSLAAEERRWGREPLLPGVPVRNLSHRRWLAGRDLLLQRPVARLLRHARLRRAPGQPALRDRALALHGRGRGRRGVRAGADAADGARVVRRRPAPPRAPRPVPDMATLLATPAHRVHGAFGRGQLGEAAFEAPVLPQHLNDTPPIAEGRAPLAGEHTAPGRRSPRRQRAGKDGGLPLAGVRIVDLTMGWAGPLTTRQLADLGAEVIKVEGRAYPDWWRGGDYSEAAMADWLHEKALYFQFVNRNKTGITLDLTQPDGADLLRRLVRTADAVVENYAPGRAAQARPRLRGPEGRAARPRHGLDAGLWLEHRMGRAARLRLDARAWLGPADA